MRRTRHACTTSDHTFIRRRNTRHQGRIRGLPGPRPPGRVLPPLRKRRPPYHGHIGWHASGRHHAHDAAGGALDGSLHLAFPLFRNATDLMGYESSLPCRETRRRGLQFQFAHGAVLHDDAGAVGQWHAHCCSPSRIPPQKHSPPPPATSGFGLSSCHFPRKNNFFLQSADIAIFFLYLHFFCNLTNHAQLPHQNTSLQPQRD